MRHSIFFVVVTALLYSGCGAKLPSVKPFKMEVQQGNVVTSKMLLQLRPGMTRSQVRYIMGTPLIVDSFRDNRWDYFYELRKQGALVEKRRVILDFDKDALVSVRGDVVPEDKTAKAETPANGETAQPAPEQTRSWTDKLKFWERDKPASETTPAKPAETPVALAAATAAPEKAETTPAKPEAAPSNTKPANTEPANAAEVVAPASDAQNGKPAEVPTATSDAGLAPLQSLTPAESNAAVESAAQQKSQTPQESKEAQEFKAPQAETTTAALAEASAPPVEAETHAVTKPGEAPASEAIPAANAGNSATPVFVDEATMTAEAKAAAAPSSPETPTKPVQSTQDALPPLSNQPESAPAVADTTAVTTAAPPPPAEPALPPLSADNASNVSEKSAAQSSLPPVESAAPQVAAADPSAKTTSEPLPEIAPVKEEPLPPLNDTASEPAGTTVKPASEAAAAPAAEVKPVAEVKPAVEEKPASEVKAETATTAAVPAAAVAATTAAVVESPSTNEPAVQSAATQTEATTPVEITPVKQEPKLEAKAAVVPDPTTPAEVASTPVISETKPLPAVVTTASDDTAQTDAAVQAAVDRWASAWRNKQLKTYLSAYAADFVPEGLPNKKAWEAQRKVRLSEKQGDITLELRNIVVERQTNTATVRFEQRYAAKAFRDVLQKTLQLRFEPKQKAWLITRETTAALPVMAASQTNVAAPVKSSASADVQTASGAAATSAPTTSGLESDAAVITAVQTWAQAWRSKSLNSYFAAYAPDFVPEGLPSKQAWEAQRKLRLSPKQGNISLELGQVNVQRNGTQATATFSQKYSAKSYRDEMVKRLTLRLDSTQQAWLIVRESAASDANLPQPKRSVTAPEGTAEHLDGTLEQIGF